MTSILDWENRLRVRLTVDLTRYHPLLVDGAEGVISSFIGSDDRFWKVRFAGAGVWGILPDGVVPIIDAKGLTQQSGTQTTQTTLPQTTP